MVAASRVRAPTARAPSARHKDNRRQALLDAAARHFSTHGFAGTSIRDIAADVGMLPGSIYYHFPSKEALALAVHAEGVAHIKGAVEQALTDAPEAPWDRLEVACRAHLVALLDGTDYAQVVTPQFARALPPRLRTTLIAQRDSYEALIDRLVAALPLESRADRRYLRLALLGALNWVLTWYHPGGDSPSVIASRIVGLFRRPLDQKR